MKNDPIIIFALLLISIITSAFAAPITPERIASLPNEEQSAWTAYIERSKATAATDQQTLADELKTNGMTQALKAPDGGDFRPRFEPGSFATTETLQLANIVFSFQAPSGGWSKHTGYSKGPRRPGMQWSSQYDPGEAPHYLATFDNGATTNEILFLAHTWLAMQREDCKAGALRGLDYVLAAQYPNGGWPQVYPLEGGYHDDITLNDDAMTKILGLLHAVATGVPQFAFVDDARRAKIAAALGTGMDCILRMQSRQQSDDGAERLAGWSAQCDALTLQPSAARLKEPVALSSVESANLLKFLMSLDDPAPAIVQSIEGGLSWLDNVKVAGMRQAEVDGRKTYVADPASTSLYWARFYDAKTNQPLFPGADDGIIYETYEAMAQTNHSSGYDFYSTRPKDALQTHQRRWRKKLQQTTNRGEGVQK